MSEAGKAGEPGAWRTAGKGEGLGESRAITARVRQRVRRNRDVDQTWQLNGNFRGECGALVYHLLTGHSIVDVHRCELSVKHFLRIVVVSIPVHFAGTGHHR